MDKPTIQVIDNIGLWQNATLEAEQAAIASLLNTTNLTEHFEFIAIEPFSCANLTFNIARFKHIKTNMVFHLIPGCEEYKVGLSPERYQMVVDEFGRSCMPLDENDYEQSYPIKLAPFFMAEFVITQAQWESVGGRKAHRDNAPSAGIDVISKEEVAMLFKPFNLRLPCEMEWEYACKAGSNSIYYWGDEPDLSKAWVSENVPFKADDYRNLTFEEQKPANAFGLVGMIGNFAEWVEDDAYEYNTGVPSQIPHRTGLQSPDGILRGGWLGYDWNLNRSTLRIPCSTSAADTGIGARLAVSLHDLIHDEQS